MRFLRYSPLRYNSRYLFCPHGRRLSQVIRSVLQTVTLPCNLSNTHQGSPHCPRLCSPHCLQRLHPVLGPPPNHKQVTAMVALVHPWPTPLICVPILPCQSVVPRPPDTVPPPCPPPGHDPPPAQHGCSNRAARSRSVRRLLATHRAATYRQAPELKKDLLRHTHHANQQFERTHALLPPWRSAVPHAPTCAHRRSAPARRAHTTKAYAVQGPSQAHTCPGSHLGKPLTPALPRLPRSEPC